MLLFCPSSEEFSIKREESVNRKAILICLIQILVRVIYDCSALKDLSVGLAPINKVKYVLIQIRFNIVHHYEK